MAVHGFATRPNRLLLASVSYDAPCPSCGEWAEWRGELVDVRVETAEGSEFEQRGEPTCLCGCEGVAAA